MKVPLLITLVFLLRSASPTRLLSNRKSHIEGFGQVLGIGLKSKDSANALVFGCPPKSKELAESLDQGWRERRFQGCGRILGCASCG